MKSNKYTLDRFEGDFAVFLKYPTETESLLVPCTEIHELLNEGDIVSISILNETYKIELLENETTKQRDKVQSLLEQLKNNKK
ncbi:DUF3006 domain-containing protein [Psychrobacillus sp. NPDC058041]|uniref:DUF3006 domain-containing protein n=1 Tax=Psychrobacillus sp. NPDC058041 TaxID=3346310 RepID=UPI0036D83FE9